MRVWGIVFLVVGLFLTLAVTISALATLPRGAEAQLWYQWLSMRLPEVFGILISIVAGLALLAGALHRDRVESLTPLALAFLAGILLLSRHWLIALAFAALGVAALVPEWFRRPVPPTNESPTSPV